MQRGFYYNANISVVIFSLQCISLSLHVIKNFILHALIYLPLHYENNVFSSEFRRYLYTSNGFHGKTLSLRTHTKDGTMIIQTTESWVTFMAQLSWRLKF